MKINAVPFDDKLEIPLGNFKNYNPDLNFDYYKHSYKYGLNSLTHLSWQSNNYKTPKEMLKDRLGKQLLCKMYNYRNWIWTISNNDNTAVLYVLYDVRGITISYKKKSEPQAVVELYKELIDFILYQ